MIYSAVLVTDVQQSDSVTSHLCFLKHLQKIQIAAGLRTITAMHIHTHTPIQKPKPHALGSSLILQATSGRRCLITKVTLSCHTLQQPQHTYTHTQALFFTYTSKKSLGEVNSNPLQYPCLENPMDRGAWWAAVHGVARSRAQLSDFTFTFHFHALEMEMAPHSSILAWRIPGTGEPGGLPSMGSHRVRHD